MAKVKITATALTRTGLMKDEDYREHILDVLGKNKALLEEAYDYGFDINRVAAWQGQTVLVKMEQNTERQNVYVTLYSCDKSEVLGTATFGRTSFFKGVYTDRFDYED